MSATPVDSIRLTKQLLSRKEAAQQLNMHISTVARLARQGRLPAYRIGRGYWAFPIEAVMAHRPKLKCRRDAAERAEKILEMVSLHTHVPIAILQKAYHQGKSGRGTEALALSRAIAIWLMREVGHLSYPNIGLAMHRDHSTCLFAYKKLAQRTALIAGLEDLKEQARQALAQ